MADDPAHRIITLENIAEGTAPDRSLVQVRGFACGIVERDGTGIHSEEFAGFLRDSAGYPERYLFFYGSCVGSLPIDLAMLRASAETVRQVTLQGTLRLRPSPDKKYELRVSGISFAGYHSLGFERKAGS